MRGGYFILTCHLSSQVHIAEATIWPREGKMTGIFNSQNMTLSDISSKITSLTGADTNQYTNAERLIDLNIWQNNVVGMIFDSQDEIDFDDANRTDYPRKTTLLTTNRDYTIPTSESMLKIKSLSVAYDGVTFYRATPVEFAATQLAEATSTSTTQNATIDSFFLRTSPQYNVKFNSIFLYPKATSADVASGGLMLVEWFRDATPFTLSDLTTGTLVPGFDEPFHAILAYGCAYEYLRANDMKRAEKILQDLNTYETRLRRQYSSKQLDRSYQITGDYQSMK